MLLAVVVSVLGASVEVAVDAPCVEAAFSGRLANAGVVLPPDTTVSLRRARGDVLEVTLKPRGAAPMRREVPAAARDCAGVERVVVALVKAWLASPVMVARAGRDGGALVDGGAVVRVDGGAMSALVDAGSLRVAGSGVDAEVDGGPVTPALSSAMTVVRSGVDGGPVTLSPGDVSATAVRSAVDGGPATLSPGDVSGAATAVRSAVDAGPVAQSPGDVSGAARMGVDAGPVTSSPGDVAGAARSGVDGATVVRDATTTPGARPDGGFVTPSRVDGAADDTRRASVREMPDAGSVEGAPASSLDPEVTRLTSLADGGAVAATADAGTDAPLWSFGVGLLGGIASGTTTDIVPQGLLSVDVSRGWFGAALDVGLSGDVSRQVPPGAVSSSWQWLSLSARAVWEPLRRVWLDAQVGVRAHRIVAVATGYAETKPEQQLLSLGAVGSVGASVRIVGPVGLTVRASGVVKPPERFTIDNLGAVLDLGTLEGGVHAGVVVRW
ncbi:MAG: hypothetical protein Q8N26_22520 [Myxococcales bacterium]|nr:hypothetical protein [Myxococcales bacterium]